MSVATERRVEFIVERGRDFKSTLELPHSFDGLIPGHVAYPGDPIVDNVRMLISEAWRVLDCDRNALHDWPFKVSVSVFPRSLTLSIRPHLPQGDNE